MGWLGGEAVIPRLLHTYMTPIILFANRSGGLEAKDLPYLHAELRAITLFGDMRASWRHMRSKVHKPTPATLLRAVLNTMRSEITILLSISWLSAMLFYAPAFCINRFVSVFEQGEANGVRDVRTGVVWALAMFATSLTQNVLMGILMMVCNSGLRSKIKQQMTSLLFEKALRRQEISDSSANGSSPSATVAEVENGGNDNNNKKDGKKEKKGEEDEEEEEGAKRFASKAAVMTLASNDTDRIANLSFYLFTMCVAPIEIIVGFSFVFFLLGWGAAVGLVSCLLLVPVIHLLAKLDSKFQDRLMKTRDQRVTFLNEAIEAIRMIKFSAWETKVMDRIMISRRKELKELHKVFLCEVGNETVMSFSPILVIIIAFFWSILVDGRKLTPSKAFTAVAALNELRFALIELPSLIESLVELWVSLRRIVAFLELPEVELPHGEAAEPIKEIRFENATVTWPVHPPESGTQPAAAPVTDPFKLKGVTTTFEYGKINLICGKVGSGKSMMLLGLLGELTLDEGIIVGPRSHPNALGGPLTAPDFIKPDEWIRSDLVAYIPQTAWLVNASLRDNITWGLPMDENRYRETLRVCALLPDLAILEDGDLTDIGEQGIGLSGGQKTRVCLARCVYSRASVLLLDSPLSNVDAHTASHIHEELLKGPLLANRTTILVSHQVAMLAPSAAKVLLLENGEVRYDGDAKAFLGSGHYAGLLEDLEEEAETTELPAPAQANETISLPSSGAATPTTGATSAATTPTTSKAPSINKVDRDDPKEAGVLKQTRKVMSEESKQRGAVSWKTYRSWIEAAGGWRYFTPVLVLFFIFAGWDVVASLWLKDLSADANRASPTRTPLYWLTGYAILLSMTSVIKAFTYLTLYMVSLGASKRLFQTMLVSCFRAKLRIHDTIPKGRFLNRFSSDMENNDQSLPTFFAALVSCFLSFVFGIVAVVISGGANLIVILFFLGPFIYYTGSLYRTTTRDVRRLEAISRSPITTCFSDLLSGAVVVRAFGSSGRMMADLLSKSDNSTRFTWLLSQTTRWMICLYQLSSALLVLAGSLALLFNPNTNSAGAGFATSFLVTTDFLLAMALLCTSNFEQKAVSTERIIEYQELPQEPPTHLPPGPPPSWPSEGSVEIEDLEIKYAPELPTILEGISLAIPGRAKVGIVGKTGCGKSTLASCFFRFVEPVSGRIKIDGVDISTLGLEELRSRITIVPQDPVILSGKLREAVDPFYDYSDDDVKAALQKVHLVPTDEIAAASSPFSDLSYAISEGGSNLSGGERQLICLARALLGSCKLVFFDEASSALDAETDAAIAETIRKAFINSTVLTIAHRLRTIADFDYILVMDKGQVLEFDKPIRLIDDHNSRYHKLCKAAGKAEFRELREMALRASSRL
ncbi:P-loop containing nucleoside triphosphate hydrolase protein [Tilletiaria anomala UBC 951]|uniref:p-loop containing nucleoside triphosphate hydrolase protein n=1 Tax=Tilletiaria anomala (strain ATCC 24038 / CBS 436.72 / UBC 951) TaxID=1037660 RepID=A0A066W1I8_TILAU|nr:P-loop containing nucleoside triphosphate hydrolase protein [Tilletiaria anomala UBC 951]KDN44924.1 P-loop containing nucleoside triphosphate hydrolase protein [Tilletiaria anomala UBC 951]